MRERQKLEAYRATNNNSNNKNTYVDNVRRQNHVHLTTMFLGKRYGGCRSPQQLMTRNSVGPTIDHDIVSQLNQCVRITVGQVHEDEDVLVVVSSLISLPAAAS
jgi:hypothetical protein